MNCEPQHPVRLYVVSALACFCQTVYVFTLARYFADTGATSLQLGWMGTLEFGAYGVGAWQFGRWSDRIGRRRMVIAGVLILVLIYVVSIPFRTYVPFLILLLVTGLANGMIWPALIANIATRPPDSAGVTDPDSSWLNQRLIMFCVSWNVGLMLGFVAAGQLLPYGLVPPFAIIASTALTCLLVIVSVPDDPPFADDVAKHAPIAAEKHGLPAAKKSRRFVHIAWLANVTGATAVGMIFYIFPKLVSALDISPQNHGFMMGTFRVTVIVVYFVLYRSTFWRFRLTTTLLVQSLALAGMLIIATASQVWTLTLGLCLLGLLLGYNYFTSLFYSTSTFNDRTKGKGSGIHEATLALGLATGPLVGGLLSNAGDLRYPYYAWCGLLLVTAACQVAIYWRGRDSSD